MGKKPSEQKPTHEYVNNYNNCFHRIVKYCENRTKDIDYYILSGNMKIA